MDKKINNVGNLPNDFSNSVYVPKSHYVGRASLVLKVIAIFCCFMLIAILVSKFQGRLDRVINTESLLTMLSNIKPPTIPLMNLPSEDWGLIFQVLAQIINVALFIVNGIITLISYIAVFFNWIFL